MQVEFLVEEASAAAALHSLVPRLLPGCTYRVKTFEGCRDLLGQLPHLLPGYRRRMAQAGQQDLRLVAQIPSQCTRCRDTIFCVSSLLMLFNLCSSGRSTTRHKILCLYNVYAVSGTALVLLDADGIGPRRLAELESCAAAAGLLTYTTAPVGTPFLLLNCLAVQELEAWFLGDAAAVQAAYPALKPAHFGRSGAAPDTLPKPNDMLWQILKQGRYALGGKTKVAWATAIAPHLDPARNTSPSFQAFCAGLAALQ